MVGRGPKHILISTVACIGFVRPVAGRTAPARALGRATWTVRQSVTMSAATIRRLCLCRLEVALLLRHPRACCSHGNGSMLLSLLQGQKNPPPGGGGGGGGEAIGGGAKPAPVMPPIMYMSLLSLSSMLLCMFVVVRCGTV
jgi:hypothetical protein